jgi:hypothetical protein
MEAQSPKTNAVWPQLFFGPGHVRGNTLGIIVALTK